jgi:quinol monooxygenase YgiN
MSVIMTFRLKGDPRRLEEHAAANPTEVRGIADRAKEHGLIAHRFYGSDDGEIMVIDEWPDAESFQTFFQQEQDAIQPLMESAGATPQGDPQFWRKLETGDDVGWATSA